MLSRSATWFLLATTCFLNAAEPLTAAKIGFNEQIRPILAENCYSCHGPDSGSRKAKLRLDHAEFATAARDDLPAITPGRPEESALVERITSADEDERMPPVDSKKQLKPGEIALLKQWISEGAHYEPHWSFLPPQRPGVPMTGEGWARNPVDRFVAETLAASALAPNREETPSRLLRRVTLDLTGLPPTTEEYAAFLRDSSATAYDRVVDRLLATDACAEHLTRHWLDAVRYADTHGLSLDNYRSIWPYRDWVLEAFRQNMPFDQFTIEQIAGDLLPSPTLDQRVASGFNRCLPTTSEGGVIPEEVEAVYAKDRVETVSTIWLGLTTGCAACHDHKFDPITTRDFYSLTAFFRNNTIPTLDGSLAEPPPAVFVPAAGDRARWSALQNEINGLARAQRERAEAAALDFERWLTAAVALRAEPTDTSVRIHLPLDESTGAASASAISGIFGPAPRVQDLDRPVGPPVALTRDGQAGFGLLVYVDGAAEGTLLSCLEENGDGSGWEIFFEGGKLGFHASDGPGGMLVRAVAKKILAPGKWHHVFLNYDGRAANNRLLDLHVDGVIVAGVGEAGSVNETLSFRTDVQSRAPLLFSRRHAPAGASAHRLQGGGVWVQDFRAYDRAFTSTEIKKLSSVAAVAAAFREKPGQRSPEQRNLLRQHFLATVDPASLELAAQLDRLRAEERILRNRGGVTLIMEEKPDTEPSAHVLLRGDYLQRGERVPATTPAALPPLPANVPRNRLALARWLVAPENPLTARVTVNRIWQMVFGQGIVESVGDFGITGAQPTHPKLLDWLAREFQASGWDQKRLLRLMVTSATYRQSAVVTPELLERDPHNRLLARASRLRLDGEVLRDQALVASGLLVTRLGGPPVRPYQPEGVWEDVAMKKSTTRFYQPEKGENLYRRSLYTIWKRIAPPPAMEIFNAPNRMIACVRRDRTDTPLQALVMLNEPLYLEACRHLAAHALRTAPGFDGRLDDISLRLLGRRFTGPERAELHSTLVYLVETYRGDPPAARALLAVGAVPVDAALPPPDLCAWTILASEIMNLDEALTK